MRSDQLTVACCLLHAILYVIPFGKNGSWGFNIEALFSQKGSYQKAAFDDSITNEYRLRLNYFEVPLYFTYTDKDVVSFGLGGYFARLVSYNEYDNRVPGNRKLH